jgi:hypothetical protein
MGKYDPVNLTGEETERLRARTSAITYFQAEQQASLADAERYGAAATLLQEGLTLYLGQVYGLDLSMQWHIDFDERQIVPIEPEGCADCKGATP